MRRACAALASRRQITCGAPPCWTKGPPGDSLTRRPAGVKDIIISFDSRGSKEKHDCAKHLVTRPDRLPLTSDDRERTKPVDTETLRQSLDTGPPGHRCRCPRRRGSGAVGHCADVDLPRDPPVVTVWNAGHVSQTAAALLAERGFDARSLTGGMKAWSLAWNTAPFRCPIFRRASSKCGAPGRAACHMSWAWGTRRR